MNSKPTTEERIWAVASHLSALAFGMGLPLPIVGWSEQRRKSKYASFQCLQALGYQSLGYTVWLLTYLLAMVLLLAALVIASFVAESNGVSPDTTTGIWVVFFILIFVGLFALYLLLPVIAAIACAFGRDFHYPVLGNRLAKYLGSHLAKEEFPFLIEEHEQRWVASMGHFSAIIMLWGLLAPLTTWILQGRNSTFLKFQSVQTTIYQALVNLLYLGAGVLYLFGMILVFAVMGLEGGQTINDPAGMFAIVVFFLSLLVAALIVLLIPLFHILGQWAGYRVLKGENYHYPILGRMVEKRLTKSYGVQELAPGASGEPPDSTKENT